MNALKNKNDHEWFSPAQKEQVFERLAHLAEKANLSEADQIAYDKAVDSYRVSSRVMQDHYELGLEEGEHLTNLKNATNMKHLGISPDIISQVTGLTKEEIESL